MSKENIKVTKEIRKTFRRGDAREVEVTVTSTGGNVRVSVYGGYASNSFNLSLEDLDELKDIAHALNDKLERS